MFRSVLTQSSPHGVCCGFGHSPSPVEDDVLDAVDDEVDDGVDEVDEGDEVDEEIRDDDVESPSVVVPPPVTSVEVEVEIEVTVRSSLPGSASAVVCAGE